MELILNQLEKAFRLRTKIQAMNVTTLHELKKGDTAILTYIPQNKLLAPLGFREGKEVVIKSKHIFNGPIVASIEGRSVAIGSKLAKEIKLSGSKEYVC